MSDSHASQPAAPAPVSSDAQDVGKHIKGYLMIGFLQILFSFGTVALSYVKFASSGVKIIAVLLAAAANASLVAGILMHLKDEKQMIWKFLIFTGIFFVVIFALTYLAYSDPIAQTLHNHR
jgi:heme/copper-type cytochrome/quinol oxidase subunit 4